MNFDNYEFKDYIVKAIQNLKFKSFTDVQREVFSVWKKNKNILAKSKTGSGKTHAFLIPIFEELDEDDYNVQAVILSPTKELAMQTYKVAQHIASFCDKRIDIKLYSGGTDRFKEIEKLKVSNPQIVIGTPGKIFDLAVTENCLKIYKSKFLVVDEVDMTLESGFKDEVDAIASILNKSKMMFFSATLSEEILPFVKKYLDSPEFINVECKEHLNISHVWIPIKYRDKKDILIDLLKIINPYLCIIFANKKETVVSLASYLRENGYNIGEIHGDLSPRERKRVLNDSNKLKYQFIVATDLAARGIDLDGVSHIINYELPFDYEFYIHRSGRTGRMNYQGIVYTFYNDLDNEYLNNLAKKNIRPSYYEIKGGELVPFKGRNTRQSRVKPLSEYQKQASRFVPKDKKVKPGYKKKRKLKINEIAMKLKGNDNKRNSRGRRSR